MTSSTTTTSRDVTLLLCGSYNPPTKAHMELARLAKENVEKQDRRVVRAVFSPVHDAYGKPNLAKANHRIAMLKLAVAEAQEHAKTTVLEVSDWETTQSSWCTTAAVFQHFKEQYGTVFLVLGADVVCGFGRKKSDGTPLWDSADVETFVRDGLVVIQRDGHWADAELNELGFHSRNVVFCPSNLDDVSSTQARLAISEGEKTPSTKLPCFQSVIEYAIANNLYRATQRSNNSEDTTTTTTTTKKSE